MCLHGAHRRFPALVLLPSALIPSRSTWPIVAILLAACLTIWTSLRPVFFLVAVSSFSRASLADSLNFQDAHSLIYQVTCGALCGRELLPRASSSTVSCAIGGGRREGGRQAGREGDADGRLGPDRLGPIGVYVYVRMCVVSARFSVARFSVARFSVARFSVTRCSVTQFSVTIP